MILYITSFGSTMITELFPNFEVSFAATVAPPVPPPTTRILHLFKALLKTINKHFKNRSMYIFCEFTAFQDAKENCQGKFLIVNTTTKLQIPCTHTTPSKHL